MYEIAFVAILVATALLARRYGYRKGFAAGTRYVVPNDPRGESGFDQPSLKPDEVSVVMPVKDLEQVVRLADTGLRAWICEPPNGFRYGGRVSRGEAERLANILDAFDRKIVPNLLAEDPDEKERRFGRYEDRIKDLVLAYQAR